MANKRSNFYGALLALLMLVTLAGLFTSNPDTPTGFAVQEVERDLQPASEPDSDDGTDSCVGNLQHGSCSTSKPLYCHDGDLVYNCYECGCPAGKTCTENGVCEDIKRCADGSIYGECSNLLKGKYCEDGLLEDKCGLCGCPEGEVCSESGECVQG